MPHNSLRMFPPIFKKGEDMITVAFDIDDTLYKVIDDGPMLSTEKDRVDVMAGKEVPHKFHQALDYEMINLLRWYQKNGDRVVVWSAGGVDYAINFVNKFGLQEDTGIEIWTKELKKREDESFVVDVCYDDQEVHLAKVNIRVRR
jgi:hypothetical protein